MLDMHYLRIFYEASKEQSFTKAASQLFISQSAVSIQIKKLEEQIGVQLIERTSKKFKLTYAGQELFKMTKDIFEKTKRMELEMKRIVNNHKNRITIGSTHNVGEPILPDIISSYKRINEEIEFDIYVKNKDSLLNLLREGKIDILLLNATDFTSDGLMVIETEEYPFVVATPSFVKNIDDLKNLYFLRRDEEIFINHLNNFVTKHNFNIEKEMSVNGSIETIKNLITEGIGYSILPLYSVSTDVAKKRMKALISFDRDTKMSLVLLKDQYEKPWIRDFIHFLKVDYSILDKVMLDE